MKYIYNIFIILIGVSSSTFHVLLSMEEIPYTLGLRVGMQSVKESCKLNGRSVYKKNLESSFFGVYDGYGDVTPYLAQHLHIMVFSSSRPTKENLFRSTTEHIKDCFNSADRWAQIHCAGGSTGIIALLTNITLSVAHCGNCRAIIVQRDGENEIIWSTLDHKPGDDGPYAKKGENERIRKAGGSVYLVGQTLKLAEVFPMSRAIGYHPKPKGLIADPDINSLTINPSYKFMILISHGISKVVTNTKAVEIVTGTFQLHGTPKKAAQKLVDEAYKLGSRDELTALVVQFVWSDMLKFQAF